MNSQDTTPWTEVYARLKSFAPLGDAPLPPATEYEDALNAQVIDDLRGLSPDNPDEFLGELIDMFLADAGDYLGKIAQGIETRDGLVVKKTVHALKSASGNLGAIKFSGLCLQIETASGQASPDWDSIVSLAKSMCGEAFRVQWAMTDLRRQGSSPG